MLEDEDTQRRVFQANIKLKKKSKIILSFPELTIREESVLGY